MLTKEEKTKQETKTAFWLWTSFWLWICAMTFWTIFVFHVSQNTEIFAYIKDNEKLSLFVVWLVSAVFFSVWNFFFKTLLSEIWVRSELKQKVSTFALFILIAWVVSTTWFLLKLFNL